MIERSEFSRVNAHDKPPILASAFDLQLEDVISRQPIRVARGRRVLETSWR